VNVMFIGVHIVEGMAEMNFTMRGGRRTLVDGHQ
jgi:hypothetical protein